MLKLILVPNTFFILSITSGNVEHAHSIPLNKMDQMPHHNILRFKLNILNYFLSYSTFISYYFIPLYGLCPSFVFSTIDLTTINNVFVLHSFVVCSYVYVLSI